MGFLMAISAIYFFLALYFATLFGGGYKFYFPFQVSFWFGEKSSQKESEAEDIDGVKVDSVKKVYGDFEAIKGVSMKLERGEVLALLGKKSHFPARHHTTCSLFDSTRGASHAID